MARTFTVAIDCENAAFGDGSESDWYVEQHEIARILRAVAAQIANEAAGSHAIRAYAGPARDANGNSVGRFEYAGRIIKR